MDFPVDPIDVFPLPGQELASSHPSKYERIEEGIMTGRFFLLLGSLFL
jgi:hypothetical protein